MKKHIVIVHGYKGEPGSNWFPWLKLKLEDLGHRVDIPSMPQADAPQLIKWVSHLSEVIGQPSEDVFLVGHSLGCITILRYLESLPTSTKIGGIILVAGFSQPIDLIELNNFFETPLDYEKCKLAAERITLINSDNDKHVPLRQGEVMHDWLEAKLIVYNNGGHLNAKAGFSEFPMVLDEIVRMTTD